MKGAFEWKDGYPAPKGISAKMAGSELERLRRSNEGKLTPEIVVTASKHRAAPLHRCFEWDDDKASRLYRLQQARQLLGAVQIVEPPEKGITPPPIRAFVHVTQGGASSYTSTAVAMSDPELRAQVLKDALDELQAWRGRYDRLKELSKIYHVIDETTKDLSEQGRLAA